MHGTQRVNKSWPIDYNNLLESQFWPPVGIKNLALEPLNSINSTTYLTFSNASIKSLPRPELDKPDMPIDSFVLVKSLYFATTHRNNSKKITLTLITNESSTTSSMSLLPMTPPRVDEQIWEAPKLEFQVSSFIGAYKFVEIEIDHSNLSNNYFELAQVDEFGRKHQSSVHFPINFKSDLFQLSRLSTVILDLSVNISHEYKLDFGFLNVKIQKLLLN